MDKTGTSKVGAISKAQKALKTFFEKKREIFEFFSFRKCRTMPKKVERGDSLVSSGFVSYVKKVKNERGDPFAVISADRTWPYGSSFSSFDCKKSGPIRVRL